MLKYFSLAAMAVLAKPNYEPNKTKIIQELKDYSESTFHLPHGECMDFIHPDHFLYVECRVQLPTASSTVNLPKCRCLFMEDLEQPELPPELPDGWWVIHYLRDKNVQFKKPENESCYERFPQGDFPIVCDENSNGICDCYDRVKTVTRHSEEERPQHDQPVLSVATAENWWVQVFYDHGSVEFIKPDNQKCTDSFKDLTDNEIACMIEYSPSNEEVCSCLSVVDENLNFAEAGDYSGEMGDQEEEATQLDPQAQFSSMFAPGWWVAAFYEEGYVEFDLPESEFCEERFPENVQIECEEFHDARGQIICSCEELTDDEAVEVEGDYVEPEVEDYYELGEPTVEEENSEVASNFNEKPQEIEVSIEIADPVAVEAANFAWWVEIFKNEGVVEFVRPDNEKCTDRFEMGSSEITCFTEFVLANCQLDGTCSPDFYKCTCKKPEPKVEALVPRVVEEPIVYASAVPMQVEPEPKFEMEPKSRAEAIQLVAPPKVYTTAVPLQVQPKAQTIQVAERPMVYASAVPMQVEPEPELDLNEIEEEAKALDWWVTEILRTGQVEFTKPAEDRNCEARFRLIEKNNLYCNKYTREEVTCKCRVLKREKLVEAMAQPEVPKTPVARRVEIPVEPKIVEVDAWWVTEITKTGLVEFTKPEQDRNCEARFVVGENENLFCQKYSREEVTCKCRIIPKAPKVEAKPKIQVTPMPSIQVEAEEKAKPEPATEAPKLDKNVIQVEIKNPDQWIFDKFEKFRKVKFIVNSHESCARKFIHTNYNVYCDEETKSFGVYSEDKRNYVECNCVEEVIPMAVQQAVEYDDYEIEMYENEDVDFKSKEEYVTDYVAEVEDSNSDFNIFPDGEEAIGQEYYGEECEYE